MVDTGCASFSTTVDKTNRLLKEIEQAFEAHEITLAESHDAAGRRTTLATTAPTTS